MSVGLNVKHFYQQILVRIPYVKLHINLSGGSHPVSCRQTGVTRVILQSLLMTALHVYQ